LEGNHKIFSGALRRICASTIRSGATAHDRRLNNVGLLFL